MIILGRQASKFNGKYAEYVTELRKKRQRPNLPFSDRYIYLLEMNYDHV